MARKSRNPRLQLPPLELKCMKALWGLGRGTVHDVRSRLAPERPLAYTTVLTLMDRLARKGIVEREKRGRAHVYRPLVIEENVLEQAIDRLAGDFFHGSRQRLQQYLRGRRREEANTSLPSPSAPPVARPLPPAAIKTSIDSTLL